MRPTLLLIRPRAASVRLLAACEAAIGAPIKSLIAPIMQIEPQHTDINPKAFAGVIVTSANGAHHGGDLAGQTAYVVGSHSANAATRAGGQVAFTAPDSRALLRHLVRNPPATPLLWLRGEHAAGDLATQLTAAGIQTDQAIVYRQNALPAERLLVDALQGERRTILPLYSPRSASLISAAIEQAGVGLHVISISRAVACAWHHKAGSNETCAKPDGVEMKRRIIAALQQPSA